MRVAITALLVIGLVLGATAPAAAADEKPECEEFECVYDGVVTFFDSFHTWSFNVFDLFAQSLRSGTF